MTENAKFIKKKSPNTKYVKKKKKARRFASYVEAQTTGLLAVVSNTKRLSSDELKSLNSTAVFENIAVASHAESNTKLTTSTYNDQKQCSIITNVVAKFWKGLGLASFSKVWLDDCIWSPHESVAILQICQLRWLYIP